MPHGAGAVSRAVAPPGVLTANTESCFSRATLAHVGQRGLSPARVRYSN